ncbi:DUF397 domain-containing protein [Streptomyces sp. NBC_00588]|jgi:hypothetical protein|uniref:DUF397 domain-containing protein n=1 Tax=Streptomyces sp. NBC_00588 TaxID=2975784 RepID=UPI002E7FEE36|nr:DUF397 domain-containing protein [Streptomyces sp. NBC_00588]WUB36684.1 DUF397 domain-containing protein [Streptomyces sp. NBC_00588]
MQNSQDLTGAQWRKSSFSGDTGGECVECAPLGTATWRKASYSGGTGGDCVEVADLTAHIAIRDSKHPAAGVLTLTPAAFTAFVQGSAETVTVG